VSSPAPRLPLPGETWVGGSNGGHSRSRCKILKITATTVAVCFDNRGHRPGRRSDSERVHLKLAHFLLHFRPA
jgi:hypothetical protein